MMFTTYLKAMASLMLGIDGVISLENDPFGGTAALRPEMSTGVTSQFNAINRSGCAKN